MRHYKLAVCNTLHLCNATLLGCVVQQCALVPVQQVITLHSRCALQYCALVHCNTVHSCYTKPAGE